MSETRDVFDEVPPGGNPEGSVVAGHELQDARLGRVWIFAAGVGALLVIAFLVSLGLETGLWKHQAEESPPANPLAAQLGQRLPPEPRLQIDPLRDLKELHAREDAILNSYGWVDHATGVVRIPIDRAIDLTLQRGLATAEAAPATRAAEPSGGAAEPPRSGG